MIFNGLLSTHQARTLKKAINSLSAHPQLRVYNYVFILHIWSWWGKDKQWINFQLKIFFVIRPFQEIINVKYAVYVRVYKTE
jgi:hypothetical protein